MSRDDVNELKTSVAILDERLRTHAAADEEFHEQIQAQLRPIAQVAADVAAIRRVVSGGIKLLGALAALVALVGGISKMIGGP